MLRRTLIRFDKRCYGFSKTANVLTPYWLTLSLNGREGVSLPIFFGEKQRRRIGEAFRGEWQFTTIEMVKRDRYWYAHFALKNAVEVPDEPETVTAIERGEHNLAVAVAISKSNPNKPIRGRFWRGRGDREEKGTLRPRQKETSGETWGWKGQRARRKREVKSKPAAAHHSQPNNSRS